MLNNDDSLCKLQHALDGKLNNGSSKKKTQKCIKFASIFIYNSFYCYNLKTNDGYVYDYDYAFSRCCCISDK